jgi:hypothetical protein
MTIRDKLITIIVCADGKHPAYPAVTVDWDDLKDGNIETFLDSDLFQHALGDDDIEVIVRDASDEEKRAWQVGYDAYVGSVGDVPEFYVHDLRPFSPDAANAPHGQPEQQYWREIAYNPQRSTLRFRRG